MSVLGARVGPVYGDRLDDGLQAMLHQGTVFSDVASFVRAVTWTATVSAKWQNGSAAPQLYPSAPLWTLAVWA